MSPLFSKKRALSGPTTIVILDVGSGSAAAALVAITPGQQPTVLACKRISFPTLPHRSARRLEERLMRALREAEGAIMKNRHHAVAHVAVFLPAPWSSLELRRLRLREPRAFLADKKLLQRMITEHSAGMISDPESDVRIFERFVAGMKLNGYVSPALPERAKVFAVEMILGEAAAPEMFLEKLSSIAREQFGAVPITMHSTALAVAHVLAGLTEEHSFLICDGEGELAELMLVKETIPEAHATIPVGYGTILRTVALHGGLLPEELPSALALIEENRSPLAVIGTEAIALAQKECAEALGCVSDLYLHAAPKVCFMIGDGPEAKWFAQALERSPRLKAVLPPGFKTQVVSARSLAGSVVFTHPGARRKAGDVIIGLEASFVADRFGNPEVQTFYSN